MTQDPQIEKNRSTMEEVWRELPKEKLLPAHLSGEYIRYKSIDPNYLYQIGFVDTEAYSLAQWESAFQDCRQADGTYLISKEKFISLGKYKYSGPIKAPLDILRLREGWYDLETWINFCKKSLVPSTMLTLEQLQQSIKTAEQRGDVKDNRVLLTAERKRLLQSLVDQYPSPRRRREIRFQEALQQKVQENVERSKKYIIKTTYEKGPKPGDEERKELAGILLKSAQIKPVGEKEIPTVSLKELKKKALRGKKSK